MKLFKNKITDANVKKGSKMSGKSFIKRCVSALLAAVMTAAAMAVPASAAVTTREIANEFIKVNVSTENGGYSITTVDGDILKDKDSNASLLHTGAHFDSSFTSFRVGGEDYVFGSDYSLGNFSEVFYGLNESLVTASTDTVTATWVLPGKLRVIQTITLVNNSTDEANGTAQISYEVENISGETQEVKSRMLMDTKLGGMDAAYYETASSTQGAKANVISSETTITGTDVPMSYTAMNAEQFATIVGYGINGVMDSTKPYQMTFAHWANLASTKFDYEATGENFTHPLNDELTADSAAALYYDLGSLGANEKKTFSTYYGVTANTKNKENTVLINTVAPSKLELAENNLQFIGSSGEEDGKVRISSMITNPVANGKSYENLRVVVYSTGFDTYTVNDGGTEQLYDNDDPLFIEIVNFTSGENTTQFFDFYFKPKETPQLGSFVTRVYDMKDNALKEYSDTYLLGETTNYIYLPGTSGEIPKVTIAAATPEILYNDGARTMTVTGLGMTFLKAWLDHVELKGEGGTFSIPNNEKSITIKDDGTMSVRLTDYMPAGDYSVHFMLNSGRDEGIPEDLSNSGVKVNMSSDEKYKNQVYGVVAIQRKEVTGDIQADNKDQYEIVTYETEEEFAEVYGDGDSEDILIYAKGDIVNTVEEPDVYYLTGVEKDVVINDVLNYHGSSLTITESDDGVEMYMDGKITTLGANTTVRDGSAVFSVENGTYYGLPVYTFDGYIDEKFDDEVIELRWGNEHIDRLQSIGGFLMDLKYGVLAKIEGDKSLSGFDESKLYNVITFGGTLDISFLTPGGADAARRNKNIDSAGNAIPPTNEVTTDYRNADGNHYTQIRTVPNPNYIKPEKTATKTKADGSTVDYHTSDQYDVGSFQFSAGAEVEDVMYGSNQNGPQYLGTNANAYIEIPSFMKTATDGSNPEATNGISASLGINSIGFGDGVGKVSIAGAMTVPVVGVEAEVELVVRQNESGAWRPDKVYLKVGGFEPGVNIDGTGAFWLTGLGGGVENLYDTIYGPSGEVPLSVTLSIDFDIYKVLSSTADITINCSGSGEIRFSEMAIHGADNIRILDSGFIKVQGKPTFAISLGATINFLSILQGQFGLEFGENLFSVLASVAVSVPKTIKFIGGMKIAGAELGGNLEKIWGALSFLGFEIGATFYIKSGDFEFTNSAEDDSIMTMRSSRYDPVTDTTEVMIFGSNLKKAAVSQIDPRMGKASIGSSGDVVILMTDPLTPQTKIIANPERTTHLAQVGTDGDYIFYITKAGNEKAETEIDPDGFEDTVTLKKNDVPFDLKFYSAPDDDADEAEIEAAFTDVNANFVDGGDTDEDSVALFMKDLTAGDQISFGFDGAYNITALEAVPMPKLTSTSAVISDTDLVTAWEGESLGGATVSVVLSDTNGNKIVAENIDADELTHTISVAEILDLGIKPGSYTAKLILSKEDSIYKSHDAATVVIEDPYAPDPIQSVTVTNAGNEYLSVNIDTAELNGVLGAEIDSADVESYEEAGIIVVEDDGKYFPLYPVDGYFIDIYEEGELLKSDLYFKAHEVEAGEVKVGGTQNIIQVVESDGELTEDPTGEKKEIKFTVGKEYKAVVRASIIDKDLSYHVSEAVESAPVILTGATPPTVSIESTNLIEYIDNEYIRYATKESTDTYTFGTSVPTSGTLVIDGEFYALYNELSTARNVSLPLEAGMHEITYMAIDNEGDKAEKTIYVNVDTSAPTIMLQTPYHGSTYTDSLLFAGEADPDATYSIGIGDITLPDKTFPDGELEFIATDFPTDTDSLEITITATDTAGNSGSKTFTVYNSKLADIKKVRIYNGGSAVQNSGLSIGEAGNKLPLSLKGVTDENELIDITDSPNTSFYVAAGTAAEVNDNIITTTEQGGSAMILASFNLGSIVLEDGISVFSGSVDYSALTEILNEAKAIEKNETGEDYSDESWDALQDAIAAAEIVAGLPGPSQENIDTQVENIRAAIDGLKLPKTAAQTAETPVPAEIGATSLKLGNTYETEENGGIEYQIQSSEQEGWDDDWETYDTENGITGLTPGKNYKLRVRYTGTEELDPGLPSDEIAVGTNSDTPPAVVGSYTGNGETFTYTIDLITGAEYSNDGTTWQDSNVFTDITPETEITFYARIKGDSQRLPGVIGTTGAITFTKLTDKLPPDLKYTLTGDDFPKTLTFTLIEGAEYAFDGSGFRDENIFLVQSSGTFTAEIRYKVTSTHSASPINYVSINVDKTKNFTPSAPELTYVKEEDGTYTVTIPTVEGTEYSFDGEIYGSTNTLTGVNAGETVTGYIRYYETSAFAVGDSVSGSVTIPKPQAAAAVISPNGGTYASSTQITLTNDTPYAKMYYTIDGSMPNVTSAEYTGTFTLAVNSTLKVLTVAPGYTDSEIVSAGFSILPPQSAIAEKPTISPNGGTFANTVSVTLFTPTPDAQIYYTTDGSTPTALSTLYTTAFILNDSATVKAITVKNKMLNSDIANATFIKTQTPPPGDDTDDNNNNNNNGNNNYNNSESGSFDSSYAVYPSTPIETTDTADKNRIRTNVILNGSSRSIYITIRKTETETFISFGGKEYITYSIEALQVLKSAEQIFITTSGNIAYISAVLPDSIVISGANKDGTLNSEITLKALEYASSKIKKGGTVIIRTGNSIKAVSKKAAQKLADLAKKLGVTVKLRLETTDEIGIVSRLTITLDGIIKTNFFSTVEIDPNPVKNVHGLPNEPVQCQISIKPVGKLDRKIRVILRQSNYGLNIKSGETVSVYIHDTKTGKLYRVRATADKNGFLHFDTGVGGDIYIGG
ncbi:MAG: chitobiase/beta-hexosaminidase C-terminal domain-containing protein [Ruminococcus sp.]|jgi:hypothetical protein|nr:chitobiase/beta-hexosaminidase C-terminal domain-containing protein [Ruminococcus sp.]